MGTAITPELREAIGTESEPAVYTVERGAIVKFAAAIGDANPLFSNEEEARKSRFRGLIAPPTFLRSLRPGPFTVKLKSPYGALLDGGSEWEYFEPVRAGNTITVISRVEDIYEREGRLGNMLFIVRQIRYVNQFGNVVATQRSTGISYEPPRKEEV